MLRSKSSPVIERHLLRLQLSPSYNWDIRLADPGAARIALERVSHLESDREWLSAVSVDDLGRYCDALWHFNVVPERLPSYAAWSEHNGVSNFASEAVNNTGEGS